MRNRSSCWQVSSWMTERFWRHTISGCPCKASWRTQSSLAQKISRQAPLATAQLAPKCQPLTTRAYRQQNKLALICWHRLMAFYVQRKLRYACPRGSVRPGIDVDCMVSCNSRARDGLCRTAQARTRARMEARMRSLMSSAWAR